MLPPHAHLSVTDLHARVDTLRFLFSCPGSDLEEFARALRHRARARRLAMRAITGVILISTALFRRRLAMSDAILYGALALIFALGSDRSRREESAASEVDWLRARLADLAGR